jgi:pimeloyl-ACP methyl ester carboxylesterase
MPYDSRLYTTQILLVLASSPLSWSRFHLVGYSLGGGLAVSFARYFPQRLDSLTLVAGGGLIRRHHVGWQSWFLYDSGFLPEWLARRLVKRRIRPSAEPPKAAGGADLVAAESHSQGQHRGTGGNSDANGGPGFDSASISRRRPHVSVSSVIAWQVDHHQGFVTAFLSTIRNAPIYEAYDDWKALGAILAERRRLNTGKKPSGLSSGQVLLVLGKDDPVVVPSETIEDAGKILGREAVKSVELEAGHELPISLSQEVGNCIDTFVQEQTP